MPDKTAEKKVRGKEVPLDAPLEKGNQSAPPLPVEPSASPKYPAGLGFVKSLRQAPPPNLPSSGRVRENLVSIFSTGQREVIPASQNNREGQGEKAEHILERGTELGGKPVALPEKVIITQEKAKSNEATTPQGILPSVQPQESPLSKPSKPAVSLPPPVVIPKPPASQEKSQIKWEISTPDTSIFDENPWKEKEPPSATEEPPRMKGGNAQVTAPMPAMDWSSVKAQTEALWKYLDQLLSWLEEVIPNVEILPKLTLLERIETIRQKIAQHFGIVFPPVENPEKMSNLVLLNIASQYVKYLKEHFHTAYYFCPKCTLLVAMYSGEADSMCPQCGGTLVQVPPEQLKS